MTQRLTDRALNGINHALIFGNPVSSSSTKAVLAEVRQSRAAIKEIRGLHADNGFGNCTECREGWESADWPCDTIKALDADR